MPSVTFILPVRTQPRFHKRVRMLRRAGISTQVASIEREYIEGEELEYPVHSLGRSVAGRYWLRPLKAPRILARLRALPRTDVVYAFGTEMAVYGRLSGIGRRLVVEIGDIREVLLASGPFPAMIRALDRWVVGHADGIVVTSPHFLSKYYHGRVGAKMSGTLVIENKIDRETARSLAPHRERSAGPGSTRALRIGWCGLIRCGNTWETLRRWAGREPERRELHIWGYPTRGGPAAADMRNAPGVFYHGQYRWPTDVPEVYGSVDVVCAAAPSERWETGDWRWARANRFYEAGFFRKPMLVLRGSADAEFVERFSIGMSANFFDPAEAVREIEEITPEVVRAWRQGYESVPAGTFVETDAQERLASMISSLAVESSSQGKEKDWG